MRKKLLLILALSIVAACGQKPSSEEDNLSEESANILEEMTISIDTFLVDSKEELFDLKDLSILGGTYYFSLSQNNESLYFLTDIGSPFMKSI